jgi:hypothetical protein
MNDMYESVLQTGKWQRIQHFPFQEILGNSAVHQLKELG